MRRHHVVVHAGDGGIFRLAFQGQTSKPLDHDATAAEVETALEELAAVDDVTVTGSAGGPWTVTFGGTQAALDLPRLNGDAANLTGGTLTGTIDYAYDAASQLTSATDPDSSYAYTYDALGRVLTVDNDGTTGVPQSCSLRPTTPAATARAWLSKSTRPTIFSTRTRSMRSIG